MSEALPNSKASRSGRTRARIVKIAKDIFVRDGYSDAALSEIVEKAEVTTGAIYHHFSDKKGLFLAVAESLEQKILNEAAARMTLDGSPWDQFETAILETLDICTCPEIQRVVFREAPAVFGMYEWRKIEMKYAFGLMQSTIKSLSEDGIIASDNPDMTSQIILGALIEGAHSVANSKQQRKALKSAKTTLRVMLRGLKIEP